MHFLLTNDDGYESPGLSLLAEALTELGRVTVIAPDQDRSGTSHSLTLDVPLYVKIDKRGFMYVNGTPADCMHLAITTLLKEKPDMLISGINAGANLGDDVFYSGTVAAAMEGRFLHCPAIAFSLAGKKVEDFSVAVNVAMYLIKQIIAKPLKKNVLLNINIPNVKQEEIKGYTATRLGRRHQSGRALQVVNPKGETVYWIGPSGRARDAVEGTDFAAICSNQVSITPMHTDLTCHATQQTISKWIMGMQSC